MTLNITPVARWLMCQSSDFRLSYVDNTGKRIVASSTAQKQFVLQYPKWSGLLCYTGVAKYRAPGFSHDTATWLQKVLEHPPDQPRSPEDVVSVVMREGDIWLRKIPPEDRRHTFTMIAYDNKGVPRIWVISNYERPDQPPNSAGANELFRTHIRVREPRCFVTGWTPAVSDDQRAALRDLLATVPDRDDFNDAVALINREASADAANTVSKECVVASLSPDGSGQMLVYGDLPNEFVPGVILGGIGLSIADTLKQQGQQNKMLDAMSWPDRGLCLTHGVNPVCMSFRDITGFKWPDDPDATPRQKVPVTITMKPKNSESESG